MSGKVVAMCNCGSGPQVPVKVTSDGECWNCGHYAVWRKIDENGNTVKAPEDKNYEGEECPVHLEGFKVY